VERGSIEFVKVSHIFIVDILTNNLHVQGGENWLHDLKRIPLLVKLFLGNYQFLRIDVCDFATFNKALGRSINMRLLVEYLEPEKNYLHNCNGYAS